MRALTQYADSFEKEATKIKAGAVERSGINKPGVVYGPHALPVAQQSLLVVIECD